MGEDAFDKVDATLAELMMKHFELAELVGEYRRAFAEARGGGDADAVRLVRGLPGAKYRVNTTYVTQTWLQLEGELKRLFPAG
jgi:hypothetical protein